MPEPLVLRCQCLTYFVSWGRADATQRVECSFVLKFKNNEPWTSQGGLGIYDYVAAELRRCDEHSFSNSILVPIPTSKRSTDVSDANWPGFLLAQAIARISEGSSVAKLFARATRIRKASAPESRGNRPTVEEHRASLEYDYVQTTGRRIVLIDDVLTQGTQMTACASMLRELGWNREISGVAAAYTPSYADPCEMRKVIECSWDGAAAHPTPKLL
jgi:hypothetical protein